MLVTMIIVLHPMLLDEFHSHMDHQKAHGKE